MKNFLIGLLALSSVSVFAKCEHTLESPYTFVCGDLDGKIIRNITIEDYVVKANKKFAALACEAFEKGKLKSFQGHKIDSSNSRPIGEYFAEYGGLVVGQGCAEPWSGIGLPSNLLGTCNVKVLDSVECE